MNPAQLNDAVETYEMAYAIAEAAAERLAAAKATLLDALHDVKGHSVITSDSVKLTAVYDPVQRVFLPVEAIEPLVPAEVLDKITVRKVATDKFDAAVKVGLLAPSTAEACYNVQVKASYLVRTSSAAMPKVKTG